MPRVADMTATGKEPTSELERAAASQQPSAGVWLELGSFLWQTKSWWLAPIVLALGVLGALVVLGGGAAAPFIYTLF